MIGRFGWLLVVGLVALVFWGPAADAQGMRITSITFSAPSPLMAGDVITIDLAGTPGVRAAFSIKGLFPATQLKEISEGSYHGVVTVPKGKAVRNAPLVGYLGDDNEHAAPVQASRLITVSQSRVQPPSKLPPVLPEPRLNFTGPPAPPPPPPAPPVDQPDPVVAPTPKPSPPPAPAAAADSDKISFIYPQDGAVLKRSITIRGTARPASTVRVTVTYNNGLSGMLKLAGEVGSQSLAVGKNGEFRMGPIALDGPLATDGLRFTIKAYYENRTDHGTAVVTVIGNRE